MYNSTFEEWYFWNWFLYSIRLWSASSQFWFSLDSISLWSLFSMSEIVQLHCAFYFDVKYIM